MLMKPIFKRIVRLLLLAFLFLSTAVASIGQIPQNIDPGQEVDPPSLWQNTKYIVPIAVIVVFLVGIGIWRRSKRK